MFYHDGELQYEVKVDAPNPLNAKMLQQAIGGIKEVVCNTCSRLGERKAGQI